MIESEIFTANRQCDFYELCYSIVYMLNNVDTDTNFVCMGMLVVRRRYPQSRQSAWLFLQSSELGLPHPLTRRRVCLIPLWFGGGGDTHSLGGERVGDPNSDEGTDTVLCFYVLCGGIH